jgi:adenosine deaminase
MFGTSLNQEYAVAADLLDLDEAGLRDLALAAVHASFAPDDLKSRLLAEIDDVRPSCPTPGSASRARHAARPEIRARGVLCRGCERA